MKLYMIDHYEKGVWYFTTINKAAMYIGTSAANVQRVLKGEYKQIKGWTVEEIEEDCVISAFVNPEPQGTRTVSEELKELQKRVFELKNKYIKQ